METRMLQVTKEFFFSQQKKMKKKKKKHKPSKLILNMSFHYERINSINLIELYEIRKESYKRKEKKTERGHSNNRFQPKQSHQV